MNWSTELIGDTSNEEELKRNIKINYVLHNLKNPFIKKWGGSYRSPNLGFDYTTDEIKDKIQTDPLYFTNKYFPHLYDYQSDLISDYNKNKFNIVCHSRQSGISEVNLLLALHFIIQPITSSYKSVMFVSFNGSQADDMFDRFLKMFRQLPFFMQPGVKKLSSKTRTISFDNDLHIEFRPITNHVGLGRNVDVLILESFAHMPKNKIENFYRAVYPVMSSRQDSKTIISSCPNGNNKFYKLFTDDNNLYSKTKIYWNEVPGQGANFKKEMIKEIGKRKWMQEFELMFKNSKQWNRWEKLGNLLNTTK